MSDATIYRFAGCTVDAKRRQVHCHGSLCEPQPKAFDLLLYLIENRDRVVDKDELLAALWPGVVVSESALTQAVRKARAMIGDDGDRQAVIRTVPRRGFRFVADLDPAGRGHDAANARESGATRPISESAAELGAVAVLPFTDMSPERDQEYFCDGMAEEIINELARIPGLKVAGRTSSFVFKARATDVREIGRQLGVSAVLEGSVRKSGDRLRVTAQLLDAGSGFHIWAESWDRSLEDMFAIQEQIARRIATALRRPGAAAAAPPITADELYRRGLVYRDRGGSRSQRFAIELFNQALGLDPEHARAWAGIAISHLLLVHHTADPETHEAPAHAAAARAVELDAHSPEAWTAQGAVAAFDGRFTQASAAFERALKLGPESFEAHYYYGRACTEHGQYEKAAALYERAAELEPDDYQALLWAAQAYRSLGREAAADRALKRQLTAAERALSRDPADARALSLSASALREIGRTDEARANIEKACALEPDESYVHYNAACLYIKLGDIDRALDVLETLALNAAHPWLQHDEDLDSIRDHPRFKRLMARRLKADP